DDGFGEGLLGLEEWIVLGGRLPVLADGLSLRGHRLHHGRVAAEGLISRAQRMQIARPLRRMQRSEGATPGLDETAVVGEIDFRYALGGREPPLVVERITPHRAEIVECT